MGLVPSAMQAGDAELLLVAGAILKLAQWNAYNYTILLWFSYHCVDDFYAPSLLARSIEIKSFTTTPSHLFWLLQLVNILIAVFVPFEQEWCSEEIAFFSPEIYKTKTCASLVTHCEVTIRVFLHFLKRTFTAVSYKWLVITYICN